MAEQIDSAMIPDERVCIVPVGYDILVDGDPGCPIIEDANLPNPIGANARYILTNPLGANTPVTVKLELFYNTRWAAPREIYASGGHGAAADVVIGEGVVVQTGDKYVTSGYAVHSMSAHAHSSVASSAPCRVYVTRGKQ